MLTAPLLVRGGAGIGTTTGRTRSLRMFSVGAFMAAYSQWNLRRSYARLAVILVYAARRQSYFAQEQQ